MTGGLANPAVSTAETVGATGLSLFAIVLPVIALLLIAALLYWAVRKTGRLLFGPRQAEAAVRQPRREP
jgi:hypothetical protein